MTASRSLLALTAALSIPVIAAAQEAPRVAPVVVATAIVDEPVGALYQRGREGRGGPGITEDWTRTFRVGRSGSLDLSNIAGDIVVTGGGGEAITVHAVKRVRGKDAAEARDLLSRVTIEASESAGRVEIRTNYPRMHNVHAEVEYQIQVPAGTSVAVRSVASRVQVSNVKGEVRAESVSGDVLVSGAQRVERAKSVSGDVTITDTVGADVLAASTVSGTLILRGLKARAIEAQTVSGNVLLQNATCDRAQVKSISGGLTFEGPLASGGRYEFNSHSGDVRVLVQNGTGFQVTANTFSGRLRSEIPFADAQPAVQEAGGFPGQRELRGTVGDGSALLVLKTFSGSATVSGTKK